MVILFGDALRLSESSDAYFGGPDSWCHQKKCFFQGSLYYQPPTIHYYRQITQNDQQITQNDQQITQNDHPIWVIFMTPVFGLVEEEILMRWAPRAVFFHLSLPNNKDRPKGQEASMENTVLLGRDGFTQQVKHH